MQYIVWIKDEYAETHTRRSCADLAAVKEEVERCVRTGCDPVVTVEVPYWVAISVGEVADVKKTIQEKSAAAVIKPVKGVKNEATQSETKSDSSPGTEGDSPV